MINDQISHLPLADGDILKLPRGTDESEMRQIADAITQLHPGKKILLLACDISAEAARLKTLTEQLLHCQKLLWNSRSYQLGLPRLCPRWCVSLCVRRNR